jgi:hypothetical protein
MKQYSSLRLGPFILGLIGCFLISCSNKEPYKLNHEIAGGYVIGRESCSNDTTQDYWLLDLTALAVNKQYGDTISLHGEAFTNVVKAHGLDTAFQKVGKKIVIEFTISKDKTETEACEITAPITYPLKEVTLLVQSILN